jgi:hypothetical protein
MAIDVPYDLKESEIVTLMGDRTKTFKMILGMESHIQISVNIVSWSSSPDWMQSCEK